MDDSWWTLWPPALFDDIVAFVVVAGVLSLRVLPSTRRWAPRGNARTARPSPGTGASVPSAGAHPSARCS